MNKLNKEMVDDADEDASGSVNFQEFVQLMLKRQEGGQTREEIKQVYLSNQRHSRG